MIRILHLSDIHFGMLKDGTTTHQFGTKEEPDPAGLVTVLREDVQLTKAPLTAIVITGDIAWDGKAPDYALAETFLNNLTAAFPGCPIVVIPGNHDVDRSAAEERAQDEFVSFLRRIYAERLPDYYPGLAGGANPARKDLLAYHQRDGLTIIGVNSAAHLWGTEDTPVFLSQSCLKEATSKLKEQKEPDDHLRVFLLHHHVLPFAVQEERFKSDKPPEKADPTIVANSGHLQRWLASNEIYLVLHGHQHQMHSRQSELWAPNAVDMATPVVAVGAGSAGVVKGFRGDGEPLNYNIIEAHRLSQKRWRLEIEVRLIDAPKGIASAISRGKKSHIIGPRLDLGPTRFAAERMDRCHQSISDSVPRDKSFANFISIVDDATYREPPSTMLGANPLKHDEVLRSFLTLHPEYDRKDGPGAKKGGWSDPEHVRRALQDLPSRVQFRHGPRMFGLFGRAGTPHAKELDQLSLSPMQWALGRLHNTDAYVGLYRPELDIGSSTEPFPALMGVQFVEDREKERLNAVATFRKIELSFWWVVNMMEVGELLQWACDTHNQKQGERPLKPGSITIFAALAEWKTSPEVALIADIDIVEGSDLMGHAFDLLFGKQKKIKLLMDMLEQKLEWTNEHNCEEGGLQKLASGIRGALQRVGEAKGKQDEVAKSTKKAVNRIAGSLQMAANRLKAAREAGRGDARRAEIKGARQELERVIKAVASLHDLKKPRVR